MAWWYKNKKQLKIGRSWKDDTGRHIQSSWIDWTDERKAANYIIWDFITNENLFGAPACVTVNAAAASSANLQTLFNKTQPRSWTENIEKIYNVPNDITMGALTIPENMNGSLIINIDGTVIGVSGSAGASNSGAGGVGGAAISIASTSVTVNVFGNLLAGGGGGGGGGNGGNTIGIHGGGAGGVGGRGQGYGLDAVNGSDGAIGRANAGTGGSGGNGATYGAAGLPGKIGASGNITKGNNGGMAGAAGRAIIFKGISTYKIIEISSGIVSGAYS